MQKSISLMSIHYAFGAKIKFPAQSANPWFKFCRQTHAKKKGGGEWGGGTQTGLYKNGHNWLMPMLHHLGSEPSTLWCSVSIVWCQRVNLLMSCVKDYMWPVMICCDGRITFLCVILWTLTGLGNTEQVTSKLQPGRLYDSKLSRMNHSYMNINAPKTKHSVCVFSWKLKTVKVDHLMFE